ncbi:probable ubiquitin carboxyl-terminal hydrolase MINDY-4 [Asterias amurensis]|uniref:probable ubiquitin carboxyl-terminal hydrolase MINDY-4 n=1 Tax=Asterias amurensis TaxID=7602 RepID=UPI003AB2FE45
MIENEYVENVAASLVREYLSRKGLKSSLSSMDQEMPRGEGSISNRAQLAREVNIERLLKKNKEHSDPLRSMIEIITKYFLERALNSSSKSDYVPLQSSSSGSSSKTRDSAPSSEEINNSSSSQKSRGSKKTSPTKPAKSSLYDMNELEPGLGLPQEDVGGTYRPNRVPTPVITMRERPMVKEPETYPGSAEERLIGKPYNGSSSGITVKEEAVPKRSSARPGSASRSRGLGGPITSSLDSSDRRKSSKKATPAKTNFNSSLDSSRDIKLDSEKPLANRNRLKDLGFNFDPPVPKNSENESIIKNETRRPESRNRRSVTEIEGEIVDGGRERSNSASGRPTPESGRTKVTTSKGKVETEKGRASTVKQTLGDIELGDIDDLDDDLNNLQLRPTVKTTTKAADSRPITQQQAIDLKNLLFGSTSGSFNDEWKMQGLGFNDIKKLEFGMVQHKGGPCGVLASIQACIMQHLLFGENKISTVASLQPTSRDRSQCLALALCDIVWRAGEKKHAIIVTLSSRSQFTSSGRYKNDGLTENLILNHFKKKEELLEFVSAHIGVYESNTCSGCILALYSTIFSRTIEKVIGDMDEPTNKLMGAHGYCTQDMVNLILTGRAVSNVFNDVMELDSGSEDKMILRGVNSRSDIGLLSLFEHYGSVKVGSNYKTPRYPIWVVCSESHFSVLFCLKKELLGDWKVERRFDLYYYDGLSRQQDEIRLSIDTTQNCPDHNDDDLVPPLEHCIRTKWPDAVVNWNNTEPIL